MNEDILAQLGQGQPEAPTAEEEPKEEIKYKDKKKSSGKKIEDDLLTELLMNGDNTKGMIEPTEAERKKANDDEELHEDVSDEAKLKGKGNAKPSEKYSTEFQKDIMKNPENYTIDTPLGPMTVKEAQDKGYNPLTRRFRKENTKAKETLDKLNDKDKAAVEKLFDPSQLGLAQADAEGMGISPNSPMVKQDGQDIAPTTAEPGMNPDIMPTGETPPQQGGLPGADPMAALLGGNV